MFRCLALALLVSGFVGCGSEENRVLTPPEAAAPMTQAEIDAEMSSTPVDLEKEMKKLE